MLEWAWKETEGAAQGGFKFSGEDAMAGAGLGYMVGYGGDWSYSKVLYKYQRGWWNKAKYWLKSLKYNNAKWKFVPYSNNAAPLEGDPIRPDDDGYLTYGEADGWWKWGKGQPLHVDLDKLDLSSLKTSDFLKSKKREQGSPAIVVNFDYPEHFNKTQALVYGKILFVLIGENTVMAMPNDYDFDIVGLSKSFNPNKYNSKTLVRDYFTMYASVLAGFGTPYTIYFRGTAKINP